MTRQDYETKSYAQCSAQLFPSATPLKPQKLVYHTLEMNERLRVKNSGCFVVGLLGKSGVGKTTIVQRLLNKSDKIHSTTGIDFYSSTDLIILDSQPIKDEGLHDVYIGQFLFSVCHLVIVVIEYKQERETLQFLKRLTALTQKQHEIQPEIVFYISKCPAFVFRSRFGHSIGDVISKELDPSLFTHSRITTQQYWNAESIDDVSSEDSDTEEDEVEKVTHGPWKIYAIPNAKLFPRLPTKDEMTLAWELSVRFDVALDDFCARVRGIPRLPTQKSQISETEWYQHAIKTWDWIKKGRG